MEIKSTLEVGNKFYRRLVVRLTGQRGAHRLKEHKTKFFYLEKDNDTKLQFMHWTGTRLLFGEVTETISTH